MNQPQSFQPQPPGPIDESLLDELSPLEFEALRWAVRLDDGPSPSARAEFQAWLDADPRHQAAYANFASVSQALGAIPPVGTARLSAAFALEKAASSAALEGDARSARTDAAESTADRPPPERAAHARGDGPLRRLLPSAAAAVLAICMVGGGWLGWDQWRYQSVFSRDYATIRGQNLTAELPDGSRLVLDTATQASVTLYRHRREVRLPEGQVLFQVHGNKDQPFDVLAGQSRITVVGTRFSVRYVPSLGNQSVQVSVQEGRVRVSRAEDGPGAQVVELTQGQSVTADARGFLGTVMQVPVASMAAWQDQRLNFENVPLGDVLAELRRYGNPGLSVNDPRVAGMPVTASFNFNEVGTFARVLQQVLPVQIVQRADTLEIVAR